MANYEGSLEAVDCHTHSLRYDMAVNRGTCGISDALIWSPTTSCGLPYSQREIRYGRQKRNVWHLRCPHQVTYDVVLTPIRLTNA
eukprot:scaffold11812_cov137-Skeletonema_dohrnii-CCMP3373.AAC.1